MSPTNPFSIPWLLSFLLCWLVYSMVTQWFMLGRHFVLLLTCRLLTFHCFRLCVVFSNQKLQNPRRKHSRLKAYRTLSGSLRKIVTFRLWVFDKWSTSKRAEVLNCSMYNFWGAISQELQLVLKALDLIWLQLDAKKKCNIWTKNRLAQLEDSFFAD